MSKYLYTPSDIAIYLKWADFTCSDEKKILLLIWEDRDILIEAKYRNSKKIFIHQIQLALEKLDSDYYNKDDVDVINKILDDLGSQYQIDNGLGENNIIEAFFRIIKLKLSYTAKTDFIKIKLRTLLAHFGYQRRSKPFIVAVTRTLKNLNINTYLSGYIPCQIQDIRLDDMIIFRLK
jgi:hypothetical protein